VDLLHVIGRGAGEHRLDRNTPETENTRRIHCDESIYMQRQMWCGGYPGEHVVDESSGSHREWVDATEDGGVDEPDVCGVIIE